jgi:hypothetical protein
MIKTPLWRLRSECYYKSRQLVSRSIRGIFAALLVFGLVACGNSVDSVDSLKKGEDGFNGSMQHHLR